MGAFSTWRPLGDRLTCFHTRAGPDWMTAQSGLPGSSLKKRITLELEICWELKLESGFAYNGTQKFPPVF